MCAFALAARNLNVDDAVVEGRALEKLVDRSRERGLGPGIPDVDLAKPAIHSAKVIHGKDRPLAAELEDLVDRIAELKSAVLDA